MFSQGSKSPEPQAQPSQAAREPGRSSAEPSIISADLKVVGNLQCAGDLQVKGIVEGDIKSRSVTVGEGAHVQGSIVADTVHISGSIKGQVEAPTVTVAKSAKMTGDIIHQSLSVEAGAFLEGQCRRLDTKKASEPPAVSPLKTTQSETAEAGKRVAGIS